jgi:hypothetical protein
MKNSNDTIGNWNRDLPACSQCLNQLRHCVQTLLYWPLINRKCYIVFQFLRYSLWIQVQTLLYWPLINRKCYIVFQFLRYSLWIQVQTECPWGYIIVTGRSVSIFEITNEWSYTSVQGVLRGAVGWSTALQTRWLRVWFPIGSLGFFFDLILAAALWPWGRISL